MQTFLPYADFKLSAQCLDKKRCWKQVVECNQILNALKLSREGTIPIGKKKIGWANHSCTRMWRGYESALKVYHNVFFDWCVEYWKIKPVKTKRIELEKDFSYEMPPWFGFPLLHSTHRGRLLDKKYDFFSQYGWAEQPISEAEGYFWPVDKDGKLHYTVSQWNKERQIWKP